MKKLIISPKLSKQCKANLSSMGFHLIETNFCPYFSPPVAFHPDMQFFSLFGKKLYSVGATPLQDGEACSPVSLNPKENPYHNEAKLNILQVGKLLVCNTKLAASVKLPQNCSLIHVNQGYAKCSCIPVANQGVITDDPGIAHALEREGLRVLLVEKGDILLPGYPYGMIGGACIQLSAKCIGFFGALSSHRNGRKIAHFLSDFDVEWIELDQGSLQDHGGGILV